MNKMLSASLGGGMILGIFLVIALICGFLWDYTISSWLVLFDKPDTFKL